MELKSLIDTVHSINIPTASVRPDFRIIEERTNIIASLTEMADAVKELKSVIESKLAEATTAQSAEIDAAETFIDRLRNGPARTTSPTPWTQVVRGRKSVVPSVLKESGPSKLELRRADAGPLAPIKITEAIVIKAIPVASFDQVQADGQLYYNSSADHFAFRLGGQLFHGNIGTIYVDEATPVRVKKCRHGSGNCRRVNCDYYHPPNSARPSREYRNFVAGSWLYSPAKSQSRQRNRHFGSRPNLDIDINELEREDIDRFHDQAMHDLLCSMILYSYLR